MTRIALAAVLAVCPALAAAGAIDAAGTAKGQSTTTMTQISEGHMVMNANTEFSGFAAADPGNPMNNMSGPCFGAVEVKMGAASGGGLCDWTDGTDRALISWMAESIDAEGRMYGAWSVKGGTGPWANASGGGMFTSLTDRSTGATENTVTGAISLP